MDDQESNAVQPSAEARVDRSKPTKPLPTDRLTLETQFSVLRGYAATSGGERRAVSNDEVGKTIGMNPNSVSLCNPFWESIGLIARDGRKQRPSDVVFDYFKAYQWNPDTAALKLAPVIAETWFCNALVPKLSFRPLSKIEAAGFLADEVKASKYYRDNLYLLLEYMKQVGIVFIENGTVSLIQSQQEPPPQIPPQVPPPNADQEKGHEQKPPSGMKRFAVHVPDKEDAVIYLPDDIEQEDWEMVLDVIQKYVTRWKKFPV